MPFYGKIATMLQHFSEHPVGIEVQFRFNNLMGTAKWWVPKVSATVKYSDEE